MAIIRPFYCVRPVEEKAARFAALPYDVYSREEAKEEVKKEKLSFLRIDRAETQFDESIDTYSDLVYEKARELFLKAMDEGILITDKDKAYYLYELTMEARVQTGIVATASIDDYMNNVIKKHENTREEKEIDRIRHIKALGAQTGPIFLAYKANKTIKDLVLEIKKESPIYSFYSNDKIRHRVWKISNKSNIDIIYNTFLHMEEIYIADGHHRAASAVKVGQEIRNSKKDYDPNDEYNYFLSVLFPDDELMIMDYNRVVSDLNGLNKEQLLEAIKDKGFSIKKTSSPYKPDKKGSFGLYLDKEWYELIAEDRLKNNDPVESLDVSILQNNILCPLLGISNPRTDKRIDFIGGIRGLKELEKEADKTAGVAFSLYPTSIKELFKVADANKLMPPKSTWFEPKLRSGLFIHRF